jgi:hypothetical protein
MRLTSTIVLLIISNTVYYGECNIIRRIIRSPAPGAGAYVESMHSMRPFRYRAARSISPSWRSLAALNWVAAPLMLAVAIISVGCTQAPSAFIGRQTSQGALLLDGPAARMNASDVSSAQADQVPILYVFSVASGQKVTLGATDFAGQQTALRAVTDWRSVAQAGGERGLMAAYRRAHKMWDPSSS